MCGIAGIYLRDPDLPVNRDDITSTLLSEIEARGQHATGVVALDAEGVAEWQKAACDATTFNRYRRIIPNTARSILGHTRWATQGLPAFMENNHPIRRGPFYIIHNGHVTNDEELFEKAERHRFGDVDSEAIAAHLASLGELSRLPEVMEEIDGDAAVAALDERDCARLMLARGRSSPLWVYAGVKVVIFASTESAVVKAHATHVGSISTKRLFHLKEGVALEWKGADEMQVQEFKVKPRKAYVWRGGTSYSSWDDSWRNKTYSWEESLDRQLTEKAEESSASTHKSESADEVEVTIIRDRAEDEDVCICDNCGQVTFWDDAEYRWVTDESNVSFIFCPECAAEFDDEDWLDVEAVEVREQLWENDDLDEVDDDGFSFRRPSSVRLYDELDPDEVAIIDDYANANESIVRSLAKRIMKGGSNAV